MMPDDMISTLLFDIRNLKIGKKETRLFTVNPKVDAVEKYLYNTCIVAL